MSYAKQRTVVKTNRDHTCNVCGKKLRNRYHTELVFLVKVRICPKCRDLRINYYRYLVGRIRQSYPIRAINSLIGDLRLLDVKMDSAQKEDSVVYIKQCRTKNPQSLIQQAFPT